MNTIDVSEEDIQTIGGLIFVAKIIAEEQKRRPKGEGRVSLPASEVTDIAVILIKHMELNFTQEQKTQVVNYVYEMELMQEASEAKEADQLQ